MWRTHRGHLCTLPTNILVLVHALMQFNSHVIGWVKLHLTMCGTDLIKQFLRTRCYLSFALTKSGNISKLHCLDIQEWLAVLFWPFHTLSVAIWLKPLRQSKTFYVAVPAKGVGKILVKGLVVNCVNNWFISCTGFISISILGKESSKDCQSQF